MVCSFPERSSKWKSFSWMLAMLRNCALQQPDRPPVATRQGSGTREALRDLFAELTIDLHDIDTHANEECIILHDKYVDDPDDDTNRKIEYSDKDLSPDELALSIRSEVSFKPITSSSSIPSSTSQATPHRHSLAQ